MKNINKILNVGDVLEAKIETASESGKGVIKVQDIILFVPDVKEGEIVRIKIIKLFKKIGFAEVTSKKETENESEETDKKLEEETDEEAESEEEEREEEIENPEPEEEPKIKENKQKIESEKKADDIFED